MPTVATRVARASLLSLWLLLAAGSSAAPPDSVAAAQKLVASGQYAQAIPLLEGRVKMAPQDLDAHILLGTALALAGQRSESIAALVEAVRLAPASPVANNALGSVLVKFGEMQPAHTAFARAVELDGRFIPARINLALIFAREERSAEAIQQLDQVIKISGSTKSAAYPLYLRGKLYSETKDFAKAIPDLEKATLLDPGFADGWSALGSARKASGDSPGALSDFQQAAERKPEDADAQYQAGAELLAVGKAHQAVAPLCRAMQLRPNDRSILYNLQRALVKDGRLSEAAQIQQQLKTLLQTSQSANDTNLQAVQMNNAGVELEKAGKIQAALLQYKAALDLDPSHDGFRLNYGLALCRTGHWEQGIAELREVSERNPDNVQATRALAIALEQSKKTP